MDSELRDKMSLARMKWSLAQPGLSRPEWDRDTFDAGFVAGVEAAAAVVDKEKE